MIISFLMLKEIKKMALSDKEYEELSKQFQETYNKVLSELDKLYQGAYDVEDAERTAALCLIVQNHLNKLHAATAHRARATKRDIDFVKAESYFRIKDEKTGEKITEAALSQLLNKDANVQKAYADHNDAEREAKEMANMWEILKDTHITFRSYAKKDV